MKAAVITIGDELLIGQVVNTNAAFICQELASNGFPVNQVVTVPDKRTDILREFKRIYSQHDITIVSGGLGPTHDDITKECISKFFGSKLVIDRKVLANIRGLFSRRRIRMPESNIAQAAIPENSIALMNRAGTAPGIIIERGKKVFCALPGVPHELKQIFKASLIKLLRKKFGRHFRSHVTIQRTLHTIGIPESTLSEKIGNIGLITGKKNGTLASLAFLPSNYEVRLRITIASRSIKKARYAMNSTIKKLKDRAGDFIYSYRGEPIEKAVGTILRRKRLNLSVAESCTGGLVSSKLTDVPGSSEYFFDSIIAYSNASKHSLLGVRLSTLRKYGAVSRQTAREMAEGMRKRSGSDIALSTTGIAGPSGATKKKPAGLVWIGYSDGKCSFASNFIFTKDRLRNKEIMSKMALEVLRRKLLSIKQ